MAAADSELGAELGVHAGLVASMRRDHLQEGAHWTKDPESGRIDYTPAGRSRLLTLLGATEKKGGGGAAQEAGSRAMEGAGQGGEGGRAQRERLRIVRLMPNPLWVAMALPGGGAAELRVQRREGLRVGVLLLCERRADGQWQCVQNPHACVMPPAPKKGGGGA